MDDLRAVMDSAGSKEASLFGVSEGGVLCLLFAAIYPKRVRSALTFGSYAKRIRSEDYPWAPTRGEREAAYAQLPEDWGSSRGMETVYPSMLGNPAFEEWFGVYRRAAASPASAVALLQMNSRFTGGRRGLATPKPGGQFGYLRLKTVGRRSGQERIAILGYYEDGPNLVTLAMNGWASAEPARWLNLQAHPDAIVELKTGSRAIRARVAEGEERAHLWAKVHEYSGYGDNIDSYASLRSSETAVVVLEPRPQT